MSLKTLMFLLTVTLLQSCSQREYTDSFLLFDAIVSIGSPSVPDNSVLPPTFAYRRDISNNGFDEDDYNKMNQEMILFLNNQELL